MDVEQPKALVELTDLATLALKFILQNIHTPDWPLKLLLHKIIDAI